MKHDLDGEFSRFCKALSRREKEHNPAVRQKLIRLKRLVVKLERYLDARVARENAPTIGEKK